MHFILLLILLTITEMVRIEGTKTTSDLWITPKQRNVDTGTEIPRQKYQLHYSNSRLSQSEVDAMNIPEEKINQDQQKIRGKDEDTVKSIGLNVEITEPTLNTPEHTDITSEDTPELTEITTEATSELTGITTEATPEHGQISNIRNEDKKSSETEATYETIGSDSKLNELDNATKEAIQLEERKEIMNATRGGGEKELVSGGIDNESEGVDGVEIDNDEVRDMPINMDVQDTGSILSEFEVKISGSHPRIISYPDIAANEMIEKLEGDNQVFEELRRKIHYLEESMDNHKNNNIVDSDEVGEAQMILEIMDEKMLIPFSLTLESVKEQIIKMDHRLKGDALIYVKGYIKRAENFISEAQEKLNVVVETDKEWTNMDMMENSIEIPETEVIRVRTEPIKDDADLKPENMDNLEVLQVNDIKAGENTVDNEQVLLTEEIIIGLTTDDENMLNMFHDTILEEEINEVIVGEGTNEWKATESEEVVDEEFLNHPSYEKEDMSGNEINPESTKEDMNSEYVILEKEINELMDEKRTNEKESVETFESKEVVHEDPDIDDKEDMSNNAINPQSTKEYKNSEYVIFKKEINELIDEEKSVETLDKEDNISSNGITTKSTKEDVTSKYEHFDNLEKPNDEKHITPGTESVKQQINSDGFLPTPTEPTVTDTRDENISNKFGDQVAAGKKSDQATERPEDVRGAIERKMNPKIKLILETTDFLKTNEDQTHEHDFSKDSGSWAAELILPSFTLLILSSCIIWLLYTKIKKKQVVSLNDYGRLEIVSTLQNPNYNYYKLK